MGNEQNILSAIKMLGANTYRIGKEWKNMRVYIPVYSKKSFVGLPVVIFDDGKELRLSTAEEALDYINNTN